MDIKRLYKELGEVIVKAAGEIAEGLWHEHFIVDPIQGGAGTSMNMNTNEVIANRGLELLGKEKGDYFHLSPNTHVNMAQSTNDVFPTAIHLATLNHLKRLLSTMEHMLDAFRKKRRNSIQSLKWAAPIFRMPSRSGSARNSKPTPG